jgi:alanine racemase
MPMSSRAEETDPARAEDEGAAAREPSPVSDAVAGTRVLRPRRAAPADAVRPTRAEVNLAHLRHNLRALERALAPDPAVAASSRIWGVLKADAYGHGAPAVARTLERAGVSGLCVALLEEAVELRNAGIRVPILVMGGYYGSRLDGLGEILEHELLPVVYDAGQVERIASFARFEADAPIAVHLKVDTGMGRLGASPSELEAIFEAFAAHPEVRLEGLMTHFACADAPDLEVTRAQLRAFAAIEQSAARRGLRPRVKHAANSAAMLRMPEARFDLVRPGIALFGYDGCGARLSEARPQASGGHEASTPREGMPELKPVMRVRTEIVAMRTIAAGERIGYGHTWQAARTSTIATVPMGYADGLSRSLSNRGAGLVRGRRAPIAGTVSMDLTMLDVTDIPGARQGDEVVFLGAQEGPLGKDAISAAEIAEATGTIAWEVLCSISRRVPRFYREP